MKLGTLKSETKDGTLVVVSQDNKRAAKVEQIVPTMQLAIENWGEISPKLEEVYQQLNQGSYSDSFEVDESQFHSPLPRAYQFLDGSAYIWHIVLVRKARNAEPPETLKSVPLMYQGLSDQFLAPNQDIPLRNASHGMDFEGEIGIITDFVPMGTTAAEAEKHIKLIMLINDVSLRGIIPGELKAGFGFMQGKPASAFAPFAITPEELGDAWKDSRVHLPLESELNGKWYGNPNAGEMYFSFAQLIEHAARTRDLAAGTIIGSGTVSNEDDSVGSSCLAENRMLEKIKTGEFKTPFMSPGDTIKFEMKNAQGQNLFGTIFQKIVSAPRAE